ncbi:universal stress protein [Cupriavidus basilensis]
MSAIPLFQFMEVIKTTGAAYSKIVVAVDGSSTSALALDEAVRVAGPGGATVLALYVVDSGRRSSMPVSTTRARYRRRLSRAASGHSKTRRLAWQPPMSNTRPGW